MIVDSIRVRLTLWSVAVYGLILILISMGAYVLVALALPEHVDVNLRAFSEAVELALRREAEEDEKFEEAAISTVEELNVPPEQSLTIFSSDGALLAARGVPKAQFPNRRTDSAPRRTGAVSSLVASVTRTQDEDGYREIIRDAAIDDRRYVIVVRQGNSSIAEDLEALRHALYASVPAGVVLSALAAWFLIRKSLRPLEVMSGQALAIGAQNLDERLVVPNPRDELGTLAASFNDLLARLNAAFDQQRRFMADASHELRTPLGVISSAVEITLERSERPERDYREALEIVGDESRRLRQIVDDMFTLARADAGSHAVHRQSVYLEEIVAEAVRGARLLGAEKGVDVTLGPTRDSPYAGDEGLLRRMVLNLLDNAIRYTPSGTNVEVLLAYEPAEYVITVRDHGPGIPQEAQPHVFERFYQVNEARFHDHGGSGAGLGLAIAQWVAQVHGGSVTLDRSDELGSTFAVRLPLRPLEHT
jgi:heavy metal sensor kinase